MAPVDLFFIAFIGSLLALVLTALCGVLAAAWLMHATSRESAAVRSFKAPIDEAIAAGKRADASVTAPFLASRPDRPGSVPPGGAGTHGDGPPKGVMAPPPRPSLLDLRVGSSVVSHGQ